MHETIFKDRLGNHANAVGDGHEYHQLRLQIRGKTRIRQRGHIDALDRAISPHANSRLIGGQNHPSLFELDQEGFEMLGASPLDQDIAARERRCDHEATRFDAVRDDPVRDAV